MLVIIKIMDRLERLINSVKFTQLWEGFTKKKFAVYKEKIFFINDNCNINLDLKKKNDCYIGIVDERFIGNTAIKIDDEYIAIWNYKTISKNINDAKLASLLIHEMFHCFQYENNEKRFPNELQGLDYPITKENISLRMLERKYLMDSVFEKDERKRKEYLSNYFSLRTKREKLIGDFIKYEKAIESVEGTAVYVEFKAYDQLVKDSNNKILKDLIKGFTDINQRNLKVRHSTYNQGLLLGLIADKYISNWTSKFMISQLYLSDFVFNELNILDIEVCDYNDIDYKQEEIEECIIKWNKDRDFVFEEFEKNNKGNILEEGFEITAFDPMNVIKIENVIIHKKFLRIKSNGKEQVLKGPIKTIIGENIFDVKKIEW
ncbi:MAG TPA: hypothetical protein VK071_03925 [Tissierellales bacterium]|nr:hypothetical protein [Tissierellales bacterium]